jgi:hypothetical protein
MKPQMLIILAVLSSANAHAQTPVTTLVDQTFLDLTSAQEFALYDDRTTIGFWDPASAAEVLEANSTQTRLMQYDVSNNLANPHVYQFSVSYLPTAYRRVLKGVLQATGSNNGNLVATYLRDFTGNSLNANPSEIDLNTEFNFSCVMLEGDPVQGGVLANGWKRPCTLSEFKFIVKLTGGQTNF